MTMVILTPRYDYHKEQLYYHHCDEKLGNLYYESDERETNISIIMVMKIKSFVISVTKLLLVERMMNVPLP